MAKITSTGTSKYIALALVGNPRVAVLDELTTGLDPQARSGWRRSCGPT